MTDQEVVEQLKILLIEKEEKKYWPNGNIWKQYTLRNGIRHGFFRMWWEHGELMYISNYKNGKEHGYSFSYNFSGIPYRVSHFENGSLIESKDIE